MSELAAEVLKRLSTPDRVESRLGGLEFTDGAPSAKTVETLYDHLDYVHALNAFLTAFPAASTWAIREGFLGIGVEDNSVLIFSELMDSSSRFLTANADTVYYIMFVDLNDGPMVVETPPMAFGHVRRHVVPVDHRLRSSRPRPRRRRQVPPRSARLRRCAPRGRLLRRPLAHEPRPDAGSVVHGGQRSRRRRSRRSSRRSRCTPTRRVGRAPASPPSSRAARCRHPRRDPRDHVRRGSGVTFNTIPPNDFGFWETVNELVQDEADRCDRPRDRSGTSPRSAS